MLNVLIIEDIVATSEWLSSLISEAFPDAQSTLCHDLKTAREILQTHSFALILVDVNLPDGIGIELIPYIKQIQPQSCVVMMTVLDDADTIFKSIQYGAMGYLLKDQSEEILIQKLQNAMLGDPPLSPAIVRKILQHFSSIKPHQVPSSDNAETYNLTPREEEILVLISKGLSRIEVAELITLSPHTVARYVKDIYKKLNVGSRAEAAIVATRIGLA